MRERATAKIGLALLGLCLLVILAFIGLDARRRSLATDRQVRARALLGQIRSLQQPLSQASLEFEIALQASRSASEADSVAARGTLSAAYQTLLRAADTSVAVMSNLEAGDADGESLIAAERRLLQQTRNVIRTDFRRLVAAFHDDSQTVSERRRAAEEILQTARSAGQQHLEKAQAARQKFVERSGLDEHSP